MKFDPKWVLKPGWQNQDDINNSEAMDNILNKGYKIVLNDNIATNI